MRILYLCNHDLESHSGVVTKVKAQVHEWKNNGHEVYVFSTLGLKLFDADGKKIGQYRRGWSLFRRTSYLKVIIIHLFSFLIAIKLKPQIIYSRYYLYSPFLSLLFAKFPVVIELNGDDKSELKTGPLLIRIYNFMTRELIYLGARGFVSVSRELVTKNPFHKPSTVIPNGVSLKTYSLEKLPWANDGKIHIGFSGTPNQNWHGFEKILPLIESNPSLHLHVIGLEGKNSSSLTYYGKVDSQRNLEILNSCSVCLSTLALHRKNMNEASPLKSREYILLGKRFVYAYDDADVDYLSSKFPECFLKIPNIESNVADNFQTITAFLRNAPSEEKIRLAMEEARSVISYDGKEKIRLNFFGTLLRAE